LHLQRVGKGTLQGKVKIVVKKGGWVDP